MVLPLSLPRICGGVSPGIQGVGALLRSSPHMRGCFLLQSAQLPGCSVFPAYAGVFPENISPLISPLSLPRICGGVSL